MRLGAEPSITVNGVVLSQAEAMTLRVALGSFVISLLSEGLGEDETGLAISQGYKRCADSIHKLMWRKP